MRNSFNVSSLFKSEAIKVAEKDNNFILTSGLISPYYINTEYLCGGKNFAEKFLVEINNLLLIKRGEIPNYVITNLLKVYYSDSVYKKLIDFLVEKIKILNPDYISGGERRDWFFSPLVGYFLNIETLYLFKDKSIIDSKSKELDTLSGNVVHIADMLTIGSSYTDIWINTVESKNGRMIASYNIVDRNQGGVKNLKKAGINIVKSIYRIDEKIFFDAYLKKLLNKDQLYILLSYFEDPVNSVRDFLINGDFLIREKKRNDLKITERIEKLINENIYNLPKDMINQLKNI